MKIKHILKIQIGDVSERRSFVTSIVSSDYEEFKKEFIRHFSVYGANKTMTFQKFKLKNKLKSTKSFTDFQKVFNESENYSIADWSQLKTIELIY